VCFFQALPEGNALSSANKRVSNILKQARPPSNTSINPNLLKLEAEQILAKAVDQETKKIKQLCKKYQYQEALSLLATLREPIDKFFDEVMVLTDDDDIKNNRLILLNNLRDLFLEVADISLLQ
jgi:glycyl-tRNA synthetase beta chain